MFPHAVTTSSKSSKSTTSLFNEMHKRSLNLPGRRVDRSFVQIRFIPENALSTEVIVVEMVVITTASSRIDLLVLRQLKVFSSTSSSLKSK
jgi:hypothetical protein